MLLKHRPPPHSNTSSPFGPATGSFNGLHPKSKFLAVVVKRLIEVAERAKIPIQYEATNRFTATDTDKIFHSREGRPSALVSLFFR